MVYQGWKASFYGVWFCSEDFWLRVVVSTFFPHIIVWGSYFWGCSRRPTDRRPTTDDRPTDRPTSSSLTHTRHTHVDSLTHTRQTHTRLLTVPFFYTHTRHTHVDSLTHTRQTHTRSLTVPFAHGARAGASLDTHTVDAHTFVHGARAGCSRCPSSTHTLDTPTLTH